MTRLDLKLSMALDGPDEDLVEVTDYADLAAGVSRSPWRTSEFEDAAPSTFSFTLDNNDGRFTPDNPSSPYTFKVSEGMRVCWETEGRLVSGTILSIEPSFPGAESAWAQVTITCDDMLGNAARHGLTTDLRTSLFVTAEGIWQWPLDDEPGAPLASETYAGVSLTPSSSEIAFGLTGTHIPADRVVAFNLVSNASLSRLGGFPDVDFRGASVGNWAFWIERTTTGVLPQYIIYTDVTGVGGSSPLFTFGDSSGSFALTASSGSLVTGPTFDTGRAYYVQITSSTAFSAGVWTLDFTLWVDGVSYGTSTYAASVISALPNSRRKPIYVLLNTQGSAGTVYLSRLSFTLGLLNEVGTDAATTANTRLPAVARSTPEITLDTLPTLAPAVLGDQDMGDQSTLDVFNDIVRAEQGAIYSDTTGSLVAPVETIKVRSRERVATVDYTFDVESEAVGATDFIRDITNMVSSVTADGPEVSATYADTGLTSRVGSKNTSDSVPLHLFVDLFTWATDRLWRGANVRLRAAVLTIDAMVTPTDRSADLLAMVPGDRIQITGLPSDQLGFATWDGWLLGSDETHSLTEHTFALYLQPVLPRSIILDTDLLTAGDNVTLTSNINNSVTSISLTSIGALWTTAGGDFPMTIRIGSECMTLSAVSGASSPQTGTVTRGVTDPATGLSTAAAAHLAGSTVELADYGVLDF